MKIYDINDDEYKAFEQTRKLMELKEMQIKALILLNALKRQQDEHKGDSNE